jgi:myo-inositol-1(or 4)-monophosphatase
MMNQNGIEAFTNFAMDVIQRSGQEALSFYGKGKRGIKFDEDLVTQAELHLMDYFQTQIQAHFPEHQIFRNNQVENDYSHDEKRYLWIFDPLDGADNFQTGIPIWGMSVALLENFWPIFGLFHMPVTGDLFHAHAGKTAFRGQQEISVSADENVDDESLLLTYSRFHTQYQTKFPGKIRNLGCTAAHICYVATGRAAAAVLSNESFQDLAAARVIIEAAGAKFFKMDGTDFFLNAFLDGDKIDGQLLVTAPDRFEQVKTYLNKM